MGHIFISYSGKNRHFAAKLADHLARLYPVRIDRGDSQGSPKWEQALESAIQDCDVFIVVVSPESNESEWITRVTKRAEQLDKYSILALIAGELPLRWINRPFTDFRGDFAGGFRDLLEFLGEHLNSEENLPDEVNRLLGEGTRARLDGDYATANHLIGQALALQPEICEDAPMFWEKLAQVELTHSAKTLERMITEGFHPITEHAQLLPERNSNGKIAYGWSIELNIPDEILAEVDHVAYQLHPTFQAPLRIIRNRDGRFRLNMVGWGTFEIPVEIHFKDGSIVRTSHQLQLKGN